MYRNLKSSFWWPEMKNRISEFVTRCLTCQHINVEHQVPSRTLYPLELLGWKRDKILMDFVSSLPFTSSRKNVVWVILDRLTKSTHVDVRANYSLEKLAKLYIVEIVKLHGISSSITLT